MAELLIYGSIFVAVCFFFPVVGKIALLAAFIIILVLGVVWLEARPPKK